MPLNTGAQHRNNPVEGTGRKCYNRANEPGVNRQKKRRRKELHMKKFIGLLLAVMMILMLAASAMAESQGTTMYVYTKNGKALLVRSSMSTTEKNVIGSLSYGDKVITYGSPSPGWTVIDWGNQAGYIMTRYLSKTKPDPLTPSSSSSDSKSKTKSDSFDTSAATTVEQINTLLASATTVEPYTITVRPARASGWVYLRWLPSKNSREAATFAANQQLLVIAELKDWYQAEDPDTGIVGFIYKSYVQ